MLVNKRLPPFVHHVSLVNSLEPRFRWIAFPGLIRGIGIIHFFVFILLVFSPDTLPSFLFDKGLITKGEPWRVVSFIALPPILPAGNFLLSTILMYFVLRITFLISDALEEAWGAFRTSLYVYAILGCMIMANFWVGPLFPGQGGLFLYEVLFLAFATLFPRIEFRLFLILPVRVGTLALLLGGITLISCFQSKSTLVATHILLTFAPYLFWAVPCFFRWYITRGRTAARRKSFQQQSLPEGESFHRCEECGATDSSHPDRDFRVIEGDRERCSACLDESS